ncbi:MAG: zinc ribbon domain-containing protein [Chloroflexota bacterium]
MICPNCGHHVREGAKFCDECGIVLPAGAASDAAPRPVAGRPSNVAPRRAEILPAAESASPTGDPYPSGTTMLPPDSGQARRTLAIVAIAVIVVLFCCCGAAAIALWYVSQNLQTPQSLLGLM